MRHGCKYLYGIISDAKGKNLGETYIGGMNNTVYTIPYKDIAAVVCDVPAGKIRPAKVYLASHNRVLRDIMKEGTVLPMAFGHILPDIIHVSGLLKKYYKSLSQQLVRLNGKTEMGLKVLWDVENIFEFFVRNHRELEMFRDEIFSKPYGPTHEEKIEMGRRFADLLNYEREAHTKTVTGILGSYSHEIKQNRPKDEKMVMDLAILIDNDGMVRFEEGVFEVAKRFDNNYTIDYNGPWAPYNFVEVSIRKGNL